MPKYDVLVAGEINADLILTDPNLQPQFGQVEVLVNDANLTIGSSSVIFACGVARLGLKVAFIGVVGDDIFGRFMLDSMQERGIDTSNVIINPQVDTGFSVILNKGNDRAIITYLGAIDALESEHINDGLLSEARHLHIASYFLQTKLQSKIGNIFKRAQSLGLSTSLDTNWDPKGKWEGVEIALDHTTIFFPNEREGEALSGEHEPEKIVEKLATYVQIAAMKMGEKGAIAKSGREIFITPALNVNVIDTVGAGDTFDAGFIYGYLQGWPLEKTLDLAVVCGSLSTQAPGGTIGQPTLEHALQGIKALNEQTK